MNDWRDRVTEWWWIRLDRVDDWRLDRTNRVADWWWDRVDGLDERRDRIKGELASWPLAYKLLAGGALLVLVGFLILRQVGLERGGAPKVVADGPSRTGAPVLPANVPDSTEAPVSAPAATAPVSAPAATSSTTVTPPTTVGAATATMPTPTTAPASPTTTRTSAGTSPPSTPGQLASFCGFVPGAAVEIAINGEPSGHETADSNGCVVVIRQLQPAT